MIEHSISIQSGTTILFYKEVNVIRNTWSATVCAYAKTVKHPSSDISTKGKTRYVLFNDLVYTYKQQTKVIQIT